MSAVGDGFGASRLWVSEWSEKNQVVTEGAMLQKEMGLVLVQRHKRLLFLPAPHEELYIDFPIPDAIFWFDAIILFQANFHLVPGVFFILGQAGFPAIVAALPFPTSEAIFRSPLGREISRMDKAKMTLDEIQERCGFLHSPMPKSRHASDKSLVLFSRPGFRVACLCRCLQPARPPISSSTFCSGRLRG